MAKSKKFPRTLYKKDGEGKLSFTTRRKGAKITVTYNSVVVVNEEEMQAAEEMGYVDNYATILDEDEPDVDEEF